MKKFTQMLLAVLLLTATPVCAQEWGLPKDTITAHAGARWWWLGSAVDKQNLSELMAEYARKGIRTLEITPIYGVKNNKTNVLYLSQQWMNNLKSVYELGEANGIQIDMNMSTGWPFGGPWVPLSEAAGKLVYTTTELTTTEAAPELTFDVTPAGTNTLNRVMAFPQKITGADTLDVTGFIEGNTLKWTPEQTGKWRIIAVFNGHTNQQVKRAAPGGEGNVLDHLDSAAVAHYIQHFEEAFEQSGTPYPTTFFNDSYEVFGADWTPRFFEEFEKRRGYQLQKHLQELFGLSSDKDTQVRSDYRETMGDIYLDYFVKQWNDWCHSKGVKTRNQSHGSPSNLIDTYAAVDIPEIEGYGNSGITIPGLNTSKGFYVPNSSDFATLKLASSAAHVTGKPLTSSETFTWFTEHFHTPLSMMKVEMDLMFLAGVNRMFYHGTTYSPKDAAWPGWKFYASIDMSPTNSIWEHASLMNDYINICQRYLQMGKPDNDVLVYFPVYNSWHTKGDNTAWLKLCAISDFPSQYLALDRTADSLDVYGYGSDYISDRLLQKTKVVDGMIETEGGARYKVLSIPTDKYMPKATKDHIELLKASGATVILTDRKEATFNAVVKPEPMRRQHGLRYIRRRVNDGYVYFVANHTQKDFIGNLELGVDFESAQVIFPQQADSIAPFTTVEDNKAFINLLAGESMIIRTYDNAINGDLPMKQWLCNGEEKSLIDIPTAGPYTLTFTDAELADNSLYSATLPLDNITTWENINDKTAQLMGTGVYEFKVNIPESVYEKAECIVVNLGDVRESACVCINDEQEGSYIWTAPWQAVMNKNRFIAGENKVRVKVVNLPANRIRKMDENGTEWRIFEDINMSVITANNGVGTTATSFAGWALTPSGLNAPVTFTAQIPFDPTSVDDITVDEDSDSESLKWATLQGISIPKPTTPGLYVRGNRVVKMD